MPSPSPLSASVPESASMPCPALVPALMLGFCLGYCLLMAAPASGMGPRPDELPRFAGDTHQTVYEAYSTAEQGRLLAYTVVVQFAGCPDQAGFVFDLEAEQDAVLLPGVEQLGRDETCMRLDGLERGRDMTRLRGRLGGCERGGLTATIPVDCPEGCSPPTLELRHDCAHAEVWIAGQPEIMDGHSAPRGLGWLDAPRHTMVGFHFSDLRPGPLQLVFSRNEDAELHVAAVHFVSDPEAEHTARVESLGAAENVYSAMVHAPGEYELLILLSGEEDLSEVAGQVIPAAPLRAVPVETDYAAATQPAGSRVDRDGRFVFPVDNCAGAWGRRNGLCPDPSTNGGTAAQTPPRSNDASGAILDSRPGTVSTRTWQTSP